MERIDRDEWVARYEPVDDDLGLVEVSHRDRESIDWYLERRLLWTEFEDDTIQPGYHSHNVTRYLTCSIPYNESMVGKLVVQDMIEIPERDLMDIYLILHDCPKEKLYDNVVEVLEEMQEWLNL